MGSPESNMGEEMPSTETTEVASEVLCYHYHVLSLLLFMSVVLPCCLVCWGQEQKLEIG